MSNSPHVGVAPINDAHGCGAAPPSEFPTTPKTVGPATLSSTALNPYGPRDRGRRGASGLQTRRIFLMRAARLSAATRGSMARLRRHIAGANQKRANI